MLPTHKQEFIFVLVFTISIAIASGLEQGMHGRSTIPDISEPRPNSIGPGRDGGHRRPLQDTLGDPSCTRNHPFLTEPATRKYR